MPDGPEQRISDRTFAVPNFYVDRLLGLLKPEETQVLLYVVRRTWGFQRDYDHIPLRQFADGMTSGAGEVLDRGTGLNRETIAKVLGRLVEFGILNHLVGSDYGPHRAEDLIEWDALERRLSAAREGSRKKVANARVVLSHRPSEERPVPQDTSCPTGQDACPVPQAKACPVPQDASVLSHRTPIRKENQLENQRKPEGETRDPSATKPSGKKAAPPSQKQSLDIAVEKCVQHFVAEYGAIFGKKPSIDPVGRARLREALKAIRELDAPGDDYRPAEAECKRLLGLYLQLDDSWVRSNGHDLKHFQGKLNALRTGATDGTGKARGSTAGAGPGTTGGTSKRGGEVTEEQWRQWSDDRPNATR